MDIAAQEFLVDSTAFKNGEKVVYKVYYNWKFVWVPAGEVTFSTDYKKDYIELSVEGKSYPSYDSFFQVRDNYVTRINRKDHKPVYFRRDVLEGSYERYDSVYFDYDNKIIQEDFGVDKDNTSRFTFDMPNKVMDLISSIYYVRGLGLESWEKNTEFSIPIFFDKEHMDVGLSRREIKEKDIKGIGKVKAIKVSVDLIDGSIFKEGDSMNIWISEDGEFPLMVEAPLKVGKVKAVLKEVKGVEKYNTYKVEE